jgi:hypothetical protein
VLLLIRRFAVISLILAAAACGSETSYKAWQDPRLGVSFDAPADWTMYGDGGSGKPVGFVVFVHEPSYRVDDQWIGPNILIHRLSRKTPDYPSPASRDAYLAATEQAFNDKSPGVSSAPVAGVTARELGIDYVLAKHQANGEPAKMPMRSVSVIMQKPDAYYVLEYRCNQKEFGNFLPVFERAVRTLRLN